jgi:ectoine hydroxylase-related dioxygenase (phytanoyl-CoA dioxygenase family)
METMTLDLSTKDAIAPDLIAQFHRDGHICLRGVASRDEMDFFRPCITELVDQLARTQDVLVRLDASRVLFLQAANVWRKSEVIRKLVFDKRFARIAAELMRVNAVRLYHDQALIKDPGLSPTPWHKDHYSWPLATHNTIKMFLALSDFSKDMGGLLFAAGSHHGGLFPEVPFLQNFQEIFNRVIKEHEIPTYTYTLGAGDAVFYSGDVLHSSIDNRGDRRWEVLSVIYFEDGTRVMAPDHDHRRIDMREFLPGLKPGDIAASNLNPLLYRSA